MYPADWHRIYGDKTGESARRILPALIDLFGAKSVLEVGCGNGHWTQVAIDHGIEDYTVVDGPWNNRDHLLVSAERFVEADLTVPLNLDRRYDLGICLEVAEHVRGESADKLVRSLAAAADVVLFGAAIPFQGGHGHINEQWPSYWRGLFAALGYRPFDLVRPLHWTDRSIHYWYRQNAFVYVNENNGAATRIAEQAAGCDSVTLFDAVHPEKFEEVASYEAIGMKRLLRRLPAWTAMRVRSKLSGKG
jgi:SAM-dependent methyltransferase